MRRAALRTPEVSEPKTPRDRESQIARATFGLRELLLHGAFHPGQRIAEIPLSEKLGVSRTPLRLAFERLEHEGLLKALPHSGFAANEFSIQDIWETIEVRGIIEGAAARLAAERLKDPAQLEPMRRINRAMEEILMVDFEGFGRYLDLNQEFHQAIVDLSESRVLRRSAEQIYRLPFGSPRSLVILIRNVPASEQIISIAQEHHRSLTDAIEHREGARAEALAIEHARLSRRGLETALANRTILENIPGAHLIAIPERS